MSKHPTISIVGRGKSLKAVEAKIEEFPHPETNRPMTPSELRLMDGNLSLKFHQIIVKCAERIKSGDLQADTVAGRHKFTAVVRQLREAVNDRRKWDATMNRVFKKYRLGPRLEAPQETLPPEVLAEMAKAEKDEGDRR